MNEVLSEINDNKLVIFNIDVLNKYKKNDYCKISDKEIKACNWSLQISRSEDNKYISVFGAHLKTQLPPQELKHWLSYRVNENNASPVDKKTLNTISCGIPENPTDSYCLFETLYKQLSGCWKNKHDFELFGIDESMEKFKQVQNQESLAMNLRILLIEGLNIESLKQMTEFKEIGLKVDQRGTGYKFYEKIGVSKELYGTESKIFQDRQSTAHKSSVVANKLFTKKEENEQMINEAIKLLTETHCKSLADCKCLTFANLNERAN